MSVGWSKDEHDQMDVDFTTRGRRMDELVAALALVAHSFNLPTDLEPSLWINLTFEDGAPSVRHSGAN